LDIVGLVILLTICILARSSKAGLIVAFLFSCKFAWSFVQQFGTAWSVTYVAFGLAVAVFSIMESFMSRG
jgi:predicted signal transduction protein with EAL and GGDEF domain